MKIEPEGESLAHSGVMNTTGEFEESGVGEALPDKIQMLLEVNGFPSLGVDFESINFTGSNFWCKHFKPYNYSLYRRIGEHMLFNNHDGGIHTQILLMS